MFTPGETICTPVALFFKVKSTTPGMSPFPRNPLRPPKAPSQNCTPLSHAWWRTRISRLQGVSHSLINLEPAGRTTRRSQCGCFKPVTRCSHPVDSIKHESKLKYQYWTVWRDAPLKSGVPTRSYNRGQSKLEQKNIEFHCNGLVDTNFIGSTTGTIVDDGKTYTATVNTKPFREACKV